MRSIGCGLMVLVAGLAACEKDSGPGFSSKASGRLASGESSLLADLPGGNVGLFGGNYLKLQDYLQRGPLKRLMGAMDSVAPGMSTWSQCFVDTGPSLKMMGAIAYAGDQFVMRYVMTGFGMDKIQACADKAGFPVHIDDDKKFISIELPAMGSKIETGYLQLADGALLTRAAISFPPTGAMIPTSRADLEADVAAAAKGNAGTDTVLISELAQIDRGRALWFVGDLSSTPAGKTAERLRGWMDLGNGSMEMDLAVQLANSSTASEIERAIPELRRQSHQMGRDIGALIDSLKFERKGDRVRFAIKITDAQFEALLAQLPLGGMGGGGMGGF